MLLYFSCQGLRKYSKNSTILLQRKYDDPLIMPQEQVKRYCKVDLNYIIGLIYGKPGAELITP